MDLSNWSYISGLVTVLHERLLDERTLLGLLNVADAEERRGRLRASLLYENALPGEHPAEEIEARFADTAARLAEQAPDERIAQFFLLHAEWTAFRRFAKRELTQHPSAAKPETAADLQTERYRAILHGDVPAPEWRRFTEAAALMAERARDENDPLGGMDRVADAAEAASILDLAHLFGCEPLLRWVRAWMNLRAAAVFIRAHRNGWDAKDHWQDWTAFGFDEPPLHDLTRPDESEWQPALVRLGLNDTTAAQAIHESVDGIGRLLESVMTGMLREVEGIPFGPERVFAFLWALRAEATNLKIILSAAESGMARERVQAELRTGG